MEWVVNVTPRPLYPLERSGTHCIRGWVDPFGRHFLLSRLKEIFMNKQHYSIEVISNKGDLRKHNFCSPCSSLNLSLDNFASLVKQIEEAEVSKKILFVEDKNKI